MRIRRIQVSHFLCFHSLDLELDPRLQVIARPDSAGTSSLVRLLEVFFSNPAEGQLMSLFPMEDFFSTARPVPTEVQRLEAWLRDAVMAEAPVAVQPV